MQENSHGVYATVAATTPWNDVLIAALSVLAECRIYSVDKHFEMMYQSGAGILLYKPGYGGAYNPH